MLGFVEKLEGDRVAVAILSAQPELLGAVFGEIDLDRVCLGSLVFLNDEGHLYRQVGLLWVIAFQADFSRVVSL